MAWACAMSVSLASWAKASKSSCWFCSATGSGRARRTSAASRFAKSSTMKVPKVKMAESAPTQRDRHQQLIAERGRMGWQKASGYNCVLWWKPTPVETGDRRGAAFADGRPSGDRRGDCCQRPESHAEAGTSELCSYHMKPRWLGITAFIELIHATRSHWLKVASSRSATFRSVVSEPSRNCSSTGCKTARAASRRALRGPQFRQINRGAQLPCSRAYSTAAVKRLHEAPLLRPHSMGCGIARSTLPFTRNNSGRVRKASVCLDLSDSFRLTKAMPSAHRPSAASP